MTEITKQPIRDLLQQLEDEKRQRQSAERRIGDLELELQVAQEQLQEATQQTTEFLSSMSHELRTPLNAMIGYTALTINALQTSIAAEHLENLMKAERAARHLLQLINDILDFSKIESGNVDVFVEDIDLADLIDDVVIAAEHLLRDTPVTLLKDVAPHLPDIESDYAKIKQILHNVIDNAIKFTAQGHVRVRANLVEQTGAIRVEIEDTGQGIPRGKIGKIFERFTQVDGSFKKKFRGTGLGLAITKSYCDMLHIDLGVESDEGKGTLFWLHIPPRMSSEQKEEATTVSIPQTLDVSREHPDGPRVFESVLIVDDDDMNLQLHQAIFRKEGYTVYLARSGQECLERLTQLYPDVILMDLGMPGMDGFETTRRVKDQEAVSHIPVIACSAFTTRDLQEKAFQIGCVGYITKPIDPQTLISQVAHILRTSQRHEQ